MNSKHLFLFFLATFLSYSSFEQSADNVKGLLCGKWISVQDSNEIMIVSSTLIIQKNVSDSIGDTFTYLISHKNCGVPFKLCEKNCFYVKESNLTDKTDQCYLIKQIARTSLTLVHEGGQVLDFVKSLPQ
jgi:hypothetical protein